MKKKASRISPVFFATTFFASAILFASGGLRADESEDNNIEESLASAFNRGLTGSKEPDNTGNLEVESHGHTFVFKGRLGDDEQDLVLTCVLCTEREAVSRARSLGAALGARKRGEETAEVSATKLQADDVMILDGIPVEPPGSVHAVEPGRHTVEIRGQNGSVKDEVVLYPGEKVVLETTNAEYKDRVKLRVGITLSGLGLSSAALGGIFLWLDGNCSSTNVDGSGECEEWHDLDGMGWGLIAGGIVVEVAVLTWLLITRQRHSAIEKRVK